MPNIKFKSDENYNAGEVLMNQKAPMFSASIHCFYYSCFQLIKHALFKECGTEYINQEVRGVSSHKHVVDLIINNMEFENFSDAEINKFLSRMEEIKNIRKRADYKPIIITESEAEKCKKMTVRVRNYLKTKYKIA